MDQEEATPSTAPAKFDRNDESRYQFDEALLVKDKKGKVIKPIEPSKEQKESTVAKLQAEVDKHSDRIKQLKNIIDAKKGVRITTDTKDVDSRLTSLKTEFQSVLRQKQQARDELQELNKQRDALRTETRALRDRRVLPLEKLEANIQNLEYRLTHESNSSEQEKHLHEDLGRLLGQRADARQLSTQSAQLNEIEDQRTTVLNKLKKFDGILDDVKNKQDSERAARTQMLGKTDDSQSDVPELVSEKQECYEVIKALERKIREIKDEHYKKLQEFYKLDRNYSAWRRCEERKKYEERQKAREARQAEDEQEKAVATAEVIAQSEPYELEVFRADQMLTYLRKLVPVEDQNSAGTSTKELQAPAPGMVLFKRKDDDLDGLFGGGVGGKKGKGAKKTEKPAEKKTEKRLNHTLETLTAFMNLKVDVPQTLGDIPETITKVEAKKAEYLEKRKIAKEKPSRPQPSASDAEPKESEEDVEVAGDGEASGSGAAEEAGPSGTAGEEAEQKEEEVGESGAAAEEAEEAEVSGSAAPAEEAEEKVEEVGQSGAAAEEVEEAEASGSPAVEESEEKVEEAGVSGSVDEKVEEEKVEEAEETVEKSEKEEESEKQSEKEEGEKADEESEEKEEAKATDEAIEGTEEEAKKAEEADE